MLYHGLTRIRSIFLILPFNCVDEKPKPPSEPAPVPKESIINEDDAPWRRSTAIRPRTQPESPPKPRKNQRNSLVKLVLMMCIRVQYNFCNLKLQKFLIKMLNQLIMKYY